MKRKEEDILPGNEEDRRIILETKWTEKDFSLRMKRKGGSRGEKE